MSIQSEIFLKIFLHLGDAMIKTCLERRLDYAWIHPFYSYHYYYYCMAAD